MKFRDSLRHLWMAKGFMPIVRTLIPISSPPPPVPLPPAIPSSLSCHLLLPRPLRLLHLLHLFPLHLRHLLLLETKRSKKKKENLKKTLRREYASFFAPMERDMYRPDVEFVDPLTRLRGVDSYQRNVDMLGSRTLLGGILFSDAGIVLHNIEDLGPRKLLTRWTLRLRAKVLPWGPMARFT